MYTIEVLHSVLGFALYEVWSHGNVNITPTYERIMF